MAAEDEDAAGLVQHLIHSVLYHMMLDYSILY